MLIITNRNINQKQFDSNGIGDENAFGDELSKSNELHLASVERNNSNKWGVRLLNINNLGEKYLELRKNLVEKKKNCVFFVHGYNQTFEKNLVKIHKIQKLHGVDVIAFSWPSNTHPFYSLNEYKLARINAIESLGALSTTLTILGDCSKGEFSTKKLRNEEFNFKFSFIAYSLGNFLFQNYVNNFSNHDAESRLFDNIVLCQADVEYSNHNEWVNRINFGKRVYVTINENDYVLDASDKLVNKSDRLGAIPKGLDSAKATYIDFTHGRNVLNTHQLFIWKRNKHVKTIFTELLNGRSGENVKQLEYKSEFKSYQFKEKYHHPPHKNK